MYAMTKARMMQRTSTTRMITVKRISAVDHVTCCPCVRIGCGPHVYDGADCVQGRYTLFTQLDTEPSLHVMAGKQTHAAPWMKYPGSHEVAMQVLMFR